jgi:hypothetical protein
VKALHHLTSQFTPATPDILQALPPQSYQRSKEKKKSIRDDPMENFPTPQPPSAAKP